MAVTYGAECLVLLVKWFAGSQKRRYPLGRVPTQMAWTRSLSATLVAPAWGWLWVTGERALPRAR
ncbi:MAG TPA: hypothetical protein VLY63_11080 [Anaerolineae bacterium]|nr:hypothetical protein [Anaerolineae bacterium]